MLHLSGSELVVVALFSLLWAFFGYLLSEQARKTTGRTPWGLSSWLWAFFWFLSLILGLVLYLIYLGTRASSARRTQGQGPGLGGMQASARGPASHFPTYPTPVNRNPGTSSGPDPGVSPAATPADWYPDPSGRFHYRWWDGTQWTSQVSTDGRHHLDTHPDQRIGPY